ncbi:SDR family oxidoreductase [Piscinibacter terrae]|uniref:Dehydrogenase n=1 Tax=Piscinibacter terrae TaxID=2496871 RepID=A0A3N7HI76_9BURK|nr:SDR family oxidoreductase [Albitalea terrae]RQP21744.1 dehydrogenase [Albitalea terrae]
MNVLLSGATGTLGVPLVRALLAAHPALRITCVLRSGKSLQALRESLEPAMHGRIVPLLADLADTGGVEAAAAALQPGGAMIGVHLAADVSWDKPCDEMVQVNVEGSRNFCRLLHAASIAPQLIYVSTAYTQTHGWTYRNGYEESKALAEISLRKEFGARMPISTFSCSLVVGDSRTGEIARFNGLYPLIKFMAAFNPPFLVGNKDGLLDIVPVDWVVHELAGLVEWLSSGGEPTEVVASAGNTRIRYEAAVRLIERQLSLARGEQGQPSAPPVPILRDRQWGFLKRSLAAWQPPGISASDFRYFERLLQVYGTYASSDRVRAPLNVRTPAPDPHDYLPKAIAHWVDRHPRVMRPRTVGEAA